MEAGRWTSASDPVRRDLRRFIGPQRVRGSLLRTGAAALGVAAYHAGRQALGYYGTRGVLEAEGLHMPFRRPTPAKRKYPAAPPAPRKKFKSAPTQVDIDQPARRRYHPFWGFKSSMPRGIGYGGRYPYRRRSYPYKPMYRRRPLGKRSGRVLTSVPRGIPIGPVPNEMVKRLQLNYTRIINGTAATRVKMQIVGNTHYQPIREAEEGVGAANNQVYGFDQLAAFYHRYRITGATIQITLQQVSTVTNLGDTAIPLRYPVLARLWAQEQDTQTEPSTASAQGEYGAIRRMLSFDDVHKLFSSKSTRGVLGPGHDDIEQLTGATADPTDSWMWVLDMGPIETVGASEAWAVAVDVKVTYTYHFYDKKTLTQSTA